MKRIHAAVLILFSVSACNRDGLSRQEAETIIRDQMKFPRPLEFKVLTLDPVQARIAYESNLEEEGYITIQRTQELKDVGKPLILFTEKAKPYLLKGSAMQTELNIQPVRLADEELVEVTGIKKESDVAVTVKFKTILRNLTPFTALLPKELKASTSENIVKLALYDDGWRIEKTE